jgi:hypothetical protein
MAYNANTESTVKRFKRKVLSFLKNCTAKRQMLNTMGMQRKFAR